MLLFAQKKRSRNFFCAP